MFVELVEHSYRDKANRGKIVPLGEVNKSPAEYERYISLFPFNKSILEYVTDTGSISGHSGKHYCPYICIDLDHEDLGRAQKSAVDVVQRLRSGYEISPSELFIYFSGNKGFHINIVDKLYGEIEPSEDLPARIKLFAEGLFKDIEGFDTKIYEPHRLIRLSNSLNASSGLYKIEITYKELLELSPEQIKELANSPREGLKRQTAYSQIQVNERLKREVRSVRLINKTSTGNDREGFFLPPTKGDRNNTLYAQACSLFKNSILSERAVFDIISNSNSGCDEPLTEAELRALIYSASKRRDPSADEELSIKGFGEWVPEWHDSIKPEQNKIDLVFNKLNTEFKGKLRGTLGVILGYGGTKKSLFAQNLVHCNLRKHSHRSIYSTMEMGIPQVMNRFIDMTAEEEEQNASSMLLESEKKNPGSAYKVMSDIIAPSIGNKIMLTPNSSMTSEKYNILIEKVTREIGQTDILIVDGLSMMGGKGTETENYSKNSKELKELAKKWNILVLLIAHASRGAELTTRGLERHVRGSEKVMDNADWSMTMSMIKQGTEIYDQSHGVYRLWNKRGSGNIVEGVYQFNPIRLLMEDTNLALSDIQVYCELE